jgi:hypothetical protein
MNWLDKLERKYGKYAINNLMLYVVSLYIIGFILIYLNILSHMDLRLIPAAVYAGQYWRIITFLFIPPTGNIFFFAFVLYFYYIIGNSLEASWGTLKFNLYYIIGVIGTLLAAFLTNMAMDTTYINLSLFLAFAAIFPEFEVRLMFVLPIKIKYLAWLQWGFFVFLMLTGSNADRVMLIVAVLNYFLFFGNTLVRGQKAYTRKQQYKKKMKVTKSNFHKCTVCGKSEKDDENLEFRFCSKCKGHHEYCSDHLFTHEHIK